MEIVGSIEPIETIARGQGIRELRRLQRVYEPASRRAYWRKRKGDATVRLPDGTFVKAEVHGYEAHGIGRVEFKIKRLI